MITIFDMDSAGLSWSDVAQSDVPAPSRVEPNTHMASPSAKLEPYERNQPRLQLLTVAEAEYWARR